LDFDYRTQMTRALSRLPSSEKIYESSSRAGHSFGFCDV
jgi:hypothetical protein